MICRYIAAAAGPIACAPAELIQLASLKVCQSHPSEVVQFHDGARSVTRESLLPNVNRSGKTASLPHLKRSASGVG